MKQLDSMAIKAQIQNTRSNLPSIRSLDDYYKHLVVTIGDTQAFYSYDSLIAYKLPNGKIVLTNYWDYSKTTTKYLSQYLGKNKKEIIQSIADFTYILEDNPCI